MIWLTNWKKYSNIFPFFHLRLLWSVQSLKSNQKKGDYMNKINKIINLTQHSATAEQKADGIFDIEPSVFEEVFRPLLNFSERPSAQEVRIRARQIVQALNDYLTRNTNCYTTHVMIGGAPFLMADLEEELRRSQFVPCYAFSKRQSVEVVFEDKVIKKSVFKYEGLIVK